MPSPRVASRPRARAPILALLSLVSLVLLAPVPASAQLVRPWTPAGMDTLQRMAVEARLRFQKVKSDTIDEGSITAYDLVAQAARRLLGQLGRQGTLQAVAIEGPLDSLGLDVEVTNDPTLPSIVLVVVRNPFRPTADNAAFILWYRGRELHYQGVTLPPCTRLKMRSWWSGRPQFPYELGVVFVTRGTKPKQEFMLLRMSPDGETWSSVQYRTTGPDLGVAGETSFPDVNADGVPELLADTPVEPDSFLALAPSVPQLVSERLYTERPEGFVLHDERLLPGPVLTLRLFLLLLFDHRDDLARRMLLDPAKYDEAVANGWATAKARGAWHVEYGEDGTGWPQWLEVKVRSHGAPKPWIFHFTIQDGRWVIRDWIPVTAAKPASAPADSTGGVRR